MGDSEQSVLARLQSEGWNVKQSKFILGQSQTLNLELAYAVVDGVNLFNGPPFREVQADGKADEELGKGPFSPKGNLG
ncbi:MAG: hypothetical protein Ct9H90mP16_07790 [Candidatus Poseidoniales archaeon]|nr:MAG: hypothetical protein Ct9H90mP16_07790 [Candidatus Poseidoniales archaeon]